MLVRLIFLLLPTCWYLNSAAQTIYSLGNENQYIQKLQAEAEAAVNDSARSYLYLRLSLLYRRANDQESCQKYLKQGLALSTRYPFLRAAAVYHQAIVEYASRDLVMLEKYLLRADSLLQYFDHEEAYKLRGILWNNYGIVQQLKGNETDAMNAFTNKAAYYGTKSGDATIEAKAYKAIAIVFMNANQRDQASTYLTKAIRSFEKASDKNPVTLVELAEAYIIATENHSRNNKTDSAGMLLNKAKTLLAPYPQSNLYLMYYLAEGVYFDKINDYENSIVSINLGIALAEKLKSPLALNRLNHAKYNTLIHQKKYAAGATVLKDMLKSPAIFTTDKKIYYKDLFDLYSKMGNAAEASYWANQYITLSDSLYEAKFQQSIIELEKKYQQAENEKKIAALQSEKDKMDYESRSSRLMNGLLASVSLFLSASVFFVIVLYQKNQKLSMQKELHHQQQLTEAEQRLQIQLTKALMEGEEMERKRLASDLHDGLGGRLAGIKINLSRIVNNVQLADRELDKVIEQLDVSSNELRRIARNLMPETLLQLGLEATLKDMCDSLTSAQCRVVFEAYGMSNNLPHDIQLHIYRIVQELLTNALRHAAANEILVQCSQNAEVFFITIEDDGKGFEINRPDRKGIGLASVQNRVEFLRGTFDITTARGQGTTINIELNMPNE